LPIQALPPDFTEQPLCARFEPAAARQRMQWRFAISRGGRRSIRLSPGP
jgi:hypothetical protein